MHLISWASQLHCFGRPPGSRFVNLDPAAESFDYPVAMDIRELICLDDVMEDLGLGPNGGLIYCMEHLEENLDDWVADELENYLDDDYLVFDCPANNPCTGIHWNYFNSSMVLIVSLQPCIIFMDEIDAIGGRCFSEGTSVDREIQRILMELLNQLDGFDQLGKVSYGLFRDNVTRLYAFWGTDDGGCFNLLCSGFIQTGQAVTLGAATRVSTYGGEQIVIRVKIYWV